MKFLYLCCIAMLCALDIDAQHTFKAIIKDNEKNPLQSATASIKAINKNAIADSNGLIIIQKIPAGKFAITFSHVGFKEKIIEVEFPLLAAAQ